MRHEILPHESSDLILNNLYDDVSERDALSCPLCTALSPMNE
jgi:hypothetical protein